MQKKRIILLIALIVIIAGILALAIIKPKQVTPMQQTAIAEYSIKIGETDYDITNLVLKPLEITPTISAGMIPVKYENGFWTITTKDDTSWFDYTNGQPAFTMLNDGYYKSELDIGINENQLANKNVGVGVPDDPNLNIHTRFNLHVHTTICIQ